MLYCRKRYICFLMFVLLICTASASAAGFPLPVSFDNVVSVKEKHHDYGMLKGLKKQYFGEYWEEKYSFSIKMANEERFTLMAGSILRFLDNPSYTFEKYGYLEFEYEGEEYLMQLQAYAKTATIKLVKSTGFTPFLSLKMDKWPMKEKLAAKAGDVPLVLVAPHSKELEVTRLQYKAYEEKLFRAGKDTLDAKGKFWDIRYGLKKYTKHNLLRYRAVQDYRTILKKEGAQIIMDGDAGFIFELDFEGKHFVGDFEAYDNSIALQVIEEEAFSQSLVLSPDKLKSELDAGGKVTLEGVYFDTDKATLKKESGKAILSSASLLKQYSDLVIEVQGHTDSQGDDSHNMDLSSRRAKSVVNALVAEGINETRLRAKGYGETRPVADNSTEKGRARNRRVELHRISGGTERMMINIDFIKPLPGAVTESERRYRDGFLMVHHMPPYSSKKRTEKITAPSYDVYDYIIERNGKRDNSFSPTEILANYRNILPVSGAKLIGEDSNKLYFTFADRGDKRPLYGVITAYEGRYKVSVYTLTAKEDAPPAADKMVPESSGCSDAIVGQWQADYQGSKPYNTKKSYAFVTNGVIEAASDHITIAADGSARMEGAKDGYDLSWKIDNGAVLLLHKGETVRQITCVNDSTLSVSMYILGEEPTVVIYKKQ